MRAPLVLGWLGFTTALLLWGLFGFLVWTLYIERAEYVSAESTTSEEAIRGESASRLRATVQGTVTERESLIQLVNLSVLQVVEILEKTAQEAGARDISVGNVTPGSEPVRPGEPNTITVVINAEGSFVTLNRLLSMYETLVIPSSLEQFEMEYVEKTWRLTVRVRALINNSAQ